MILCSQIIGILMVVLFPKFGRPLDAQERLVETCSKDMKNEIVILDYSSKIFIYLIISRNVIFI